MPIIENWKTIPGIKDLLVSSKGRIKKYGNLVSPHLGGRAKEYWRICIHGKHYMVHRLVLMAFVGFPHSNEYQCMHLDNNKKNNEIGNLKWGTQLENMASERGKKKKFKTKHGHAKLSIDQINKIRNQYASRKNTHWGMTKLALMFGVSKQEIYLIAHNKAWVS